ncbi:MAG: pyrrolo-quinoline quinone [Planctomycetes bacterium]|nr:pyrrolo-quinoline quinone [Planctomycetota bacterium]
MITRRTISLLLFVGTLPMSAAIADDWPQWLGPKRDGVWRETGIAARFPAEGPKIRWRAKISEGYSGPAVAQGKVIVTDRVLRAGARNPKNAFSRSRVAGKERVLCLDESSGKALWVHEYDCPYEVSYAAGPRTTPVIAGDRVYTLGTMGDLLCLNLADGKVVWSKNFVRDYDAPVPLWGFAAHPLLDGDRLVCLVGAKGGLAMAFDKISGKELWKALDSEEPGYAPPMLFTAGGQRQLLIWHPESVNSLEPETGKVNWTFPFTGRNNRKLKAGLSIPTPRLDGGRLFLTAFYDGSLLLKLNGIEKPEQVWRSKGRSEQPDGTDALHSIMSTPYIKDGHIYGVCSYGELRCLDEAAGKRLWSSHQATGGKSLRWANAFLVPQGERCFLFNELGDLIIARLSPKGYEEISRANILTPTNTMAPPAGRRVIWSHPAFANRCCYARNDEEIVCVDLAERK